MAHIENTLQKHFTGHVGPVRFVNGHADCDDPELLEFFAADPDRYTLTGHDGDHDGRVFDGTPLERDATPDEE